MATTTSHNKKSSAVKRILSEAKEFSEDDTEFTASPLEDNIFEWHFTLRGPSSSEFQEGIYHGRILLPAEYPFRPPDVMLLTPNGRWELNKKICLTFTGFHEEMWQPAWGIRTALIGVQAFMGARAEAAVGVGSLDYPEEERERLARKSRDWTCPICQVKNSAILRNDGDRKEESLPDGLTVDASGGTKKTTQVKGEHSHQDNSATDTNGGKLSASTSHNGHSFGASGPTDSLVASIVNGKADREASLQDMTSIASSQITSGISTPVKPADVRPLDQPASKKDKGKAAERNLSDPSPTPAASRLASNEVDTSTRTASGEQIQPAVAIAMHSTVEPERRLAMLDRAIATVLFLLLALLLRRVLNAA